MHHGNVEFGLETLFDFKAFGCLDVLEIDTAKGRRDGLDGLDEPLGVFLVDLYIEGVHARVNLEQEALALHDGFAADSTDVAESEHRCAVGDDGYEVALIGIAIGILRILLDFETGLGHTRRIGQREVGLRAIGLGGHYFDFTRLAL